MKEFRYRAWLISTFSGWVLGVILIVLLSGFLDSIGIEGRQFYLGLGMGGGVALVQWLYLKKCFRVSILYVVAAMTGMTIPFFIVELFDIPIAYKLLICVAAGGVLTGFLQQFTLPVDPARKRLVVLYTFLAWTASALPVFLINVTMQITAAGWVNLVLAFLNLILILSGGYIYGLVSGRIYRPEGKKIPVSTK